MADEKKEKVIDKDQETIIPAGVEKDELSEEDLERLSGGLGCGQNNTKKE
jgi:hypothetical protein